MRLTARVIALTLIAAAPALAGEREWREKRKEFEAAVEAYEGDDGDDVDASALVERALQDSLTDMFSASSASSVDYLLEEQMGGSRSLVTRILDQLRTVKDERGVKALLKAYKGAGVEDQILLTPVVGALPGPSSIKALSRQLRAKDQDLILASLRALRERGPEAKDEASKLSRLLRGDSQRLRRAAALATEALTGTRPDGFPDPVVGPLGVPDRFWADRVALLVDATREAGESGFVDPLAVEGQPSASVSPYELIRKHVAELFKDMEPDVLPQVSVARFGRSAQTYGRGYTKLRRPKDLLGLAKWFDRPLRDRDRDVGAALASAIERTPTPDDVYLFLVGLPQGRKAGQPEQVVERLAALAWGRSVRVHVTAFVLEPATPPVGAQGKDALARAQESLRSFANKLAGATGGQATIVELARPAAEEAASTPDPAAAVDELKVDLTQAVSTRDFRAVSKAFRAALDAEPPSEADQKRVEDVAACPDPKVAELVVEALDWKRPELAEAAVRGVSRNTERKVRDALREDLTAEKDPARQLLLLRAYGPAPGQDVTEGLLQALERLGPDARRWAWRYLSARPDTELAEANQLKRAARDQEGLTGFYASVALSRASGAPSPSASGLNTGGAQLLPSRYVTRGVAFVVDTHRDMDAVFHTFPAPPATEAEPEPAAPDPISRLETVRQELRRALIAIKTSASAANVIQLNGRAFSRKVTLLDRAQQGAARDYVDGLRTGNHRDVWAALEQALKDPDVEAIHLVLCGLPIRSPGAREAEELQRLVRQLNRGRGVQIDVVVVLGPELAEGPEQAAQVDFLSGLERLYRPIAEDSGGELMVRRSVSGLEPTKTRK